MDYTMKGIGFNKFNDGSVIFWLIFGQANYEQSLCLKPDKDFQGGCHQGTLCTD
jgi:hypothetical protein